MTYTTRWPYSPFSRPGLGRAFEDFFRQRTSEPGEEEAVQSAWSPAVDVKETDEALTLFIEIPGVSKSEIGISLENHVLTVSGERRFDKQDQESYRRVERAYGPFHRSFRVPRDVDGNQVAASYQDGVLRLDLPKAEAAKPRQIKIH